MALKCPETGCKGSVNGMTGLQELMNLRAHYAKKHYPINLDEAMELRSKSEAREQQRAINAAANSRG